MTDQRRDPRVHEELRFLTGQLMAWLEDAAELGVTEMPLDTTVRLAPSISVVEPSPSPQTLKRPPRPRPPTTMPEISIPSAPTPRVTRPVRGGGRDDALHALHQSFVGTLASQPKGPPDAVVFGVGNPQARLMVIGDAPGRAEALTGVPFVGRSGQLLTRMLAAIGVARDDAYLSTLLKYRPATDHGPSPEDIGLCLPVLGQQVELVGPVAILAMGTLSAQHLCGLTDHDEGRCGEVYQFRGVPVVLTHHPEHLLRHPAIKAEVYRHLLTTQRLLRAATT